MRYVQRGDLIDPDLVALFATGWCKTRYLAPPVEEDAALRIEVGQPEHVRRYVFPWAPAAIAEIAAQVTEPFILLKAPIAETAMRELLPDHWHVEQTGTMMTMGAMPTEHAPLPPDYHATKTDDDGIIAVRIIAPDGIQAATGLATVVNGWALHDRIRVEEAHWRRGLGRAVMLALGAEAARQGARQGILTATDMGRQLYQTIGWQARAPWTTAQIKP